MAVELNTANVAELYSSQQQQQVPLRQREEEPAAQQPVVQQEAETGPAVVTEISAQAVEASRQATATRPTPETSQATTAATREEPPPPSVNQEPQPQGREADRRSQIDVIV